MVYFIAFVVLLGVLVFIHELGHFLMAKFFGVRVEAFSIGFGKAIWKKQVGETEYRIAPIPLGGYVKLYGEDQSEIDPVYEQFSLKAQKWYKKALIGFAGPLFNLVLAFIVYSIVFVVGDPEVSTKVGTVFPETPIYEANINTGDTITAINGESVKTWNELTKIFDTVSAKTVSMTVNGAKTLNFPISKVIAKNRFGETVLRNTVFGLLPTKLMPLVAVVKDSFFYKYGLRSKDLILSVNSDELRTLDEFNNYLTDYQGKTILLKFMRDKQEKSLVFKVPEYNATECKYTETLQDSYCSFINQLGLYSGELLVGDIVKNGPADGVIQKGDIILAVNGKIVRSHYFLQNYLQEKETADLLVIRGTKFLNLSLKLKVNTTDTITYYTMGIKSYNAMANPDIIKIKLGLVDSVSKGVSETYKWIKLTLLGFGKLILGKVSAKSLGGPVMIGKVAGESLLKGIAYFLKILAIISINLGLINLFPVPVLDGGMIVLAIYEGIMGRPMKEKHLMIIQQLGVAILLFLVVFSLYNDIGRFIG